MTLVEVMIAATVSAMVVAAAMSLFLFNYKIGFVSQERNMINKDIRSFTGDLIRDGRRANYFVLYDSINPEARDKPGDRRRDARSGDFLVLVETERTASAFNRNEITRIVAYFRAVDVADADALAPVRRLEVEFDPGKPADQLEAILPSVAELAFAEQVVELSKGLADGRLFYNFRDESVMVNGQIHHGNAAKRVTETYNFTVSPRG
jgi:hypothetical protein